MVSINNSITLITFDTNRDAGDLRRLGAHYDVIVMNKVHILKSWRWYRIYKQPMDLFL